MNFGKVSLHSLVFWSGGQFVKISIELETGELSQIRFQLQQQNLPGKGEEDQGNEENIATLCAGK